MTDATGCDGFREMISARIDGELKGTDADRLDAHVARCLGCADRQEAAWALRRSLQVSSVRETSVGVASTIPPSSAIAAPLVHELLRWALFVIGGTLVIVNAGHLVGLGADLADHGERHGAVFGVALGLAMIVVGIRPHRAIGLVPLTSTAMVLMAVVIVVDLANGSAIIAEEALHLVEFAGLICVWVISGGVTRLGALVNRVRG